MDGDQLVGVLEEHLGDLVGQFLVHLAAHGEHVGDADALYRLVHALVEAGLELVGREHGLGFLGVGDLLVGQPDQADIAGSGQVHDRAGGRAHAPEAGVDVTVADGIGGLVEVQATRVEVLVGDAVGLEQGLGVDLGTAARGAYGDRLALEIGERVDVGIGQGHDLHGIRIDRGQRADVLQLASLEVTGAVVGLVDGVGQRQGQVGVAAPHQPHVLHRGPRDLGHGLGPLDVVTDQLGEATPIGIVGTPGPAGGDGDLLGSGKRGRGQQGGGGGVLQDSHGIPPVLERCCCESSWRSWSLGASGNASMKRA